ncbi:bacteriophage head completion/stabilization protein [Chitinimonas prasina]|uniref:Bacteriophage head completion/stabilization protein n=1 Tax=Chitinimonas prasina TaxID=1434937 RepID=A0ABQ5YE50_9NEIS|nr:head completion/stabilization protein [Chitinimonas prasina]GLR13251.1 bacteriophage head completion/stabilization protein [Chitinimonas prasina]
MSNTFIAVPATPATPGTGSDLIAATGFFPSISLAKARQAVRMDGTVTDERLRNAIIEAKATVISDLATWADAQKSLGFATLGDIPATHIDGESIHVHRYRTAVYGLAGASLSERYRSTDQTKSGHEKADSMEPTIDDLRRDARWAIRDILSVSRTTVELI